MKFQLNVYEVVTYEGLYSSLAENGEKIQVKGKLEKVTQKQNNHWVLSCCGWFSRRKRNRIHKKYGINPKNGLIQLLTDCFFEVCLVWTKLAAIVRRSNLNNALNFCCSFNSFCQGFLHNG